MTPNGRTSMETEPGWGWEQQGCEEESCFSRPISSLTSLMMSNEQQRQEADLTPLSRGHAGPWAHPVEMEIP